MTLSSYLDPKSPPPIPNHWTEDLDEFHAFWTWCAVENQFNPHKVLDALGVVTLCDWRKSQAAAKSQILDWMEAHP